jgi:hypothetical protein
MTSPAAECCARRDYSATNIRAISAYGLTQLILLLWAVDIEGIQQREPLNPLKIIRIVGHQRQPMHRRRAGHQCIAEGYPLPLAECHRLVEDSLREG